VQRGTRVIVKERNRNAENMEKKKSKNTTMIKTYKMAATNINANTTSIW
jgi:hypothetical protein